MESRDTAIVGLSWGSFLIQAVANVLVLGEFLGGHFRSTGIFMISVPVALVLYVTAILWALFSKRLRNGTLIVLGLPLIQVVFSLVCLGFVVRNNA